MEQIIHRGRAALATFEELLIAELVAGNGIAGTPAAACGRVAIGMACTLARDFIKKFGPAPLEQPMLT